MDVVKFAVKNGADGADVFVKRALSKCVGVRFGEVDSIIDAVDLNVNIRVFSGKKNVIINCESGDFEVLKEYVESAISCAKLCADDEFSRMSDDKEFCKNILSDEQLGIYDRYEPYENELICLAKEAEDAAFQVEGVVNSESTQVVNEKGEFFLCSSNGFCGTYKNSMNELATVILASNGEDSQRDWAFSRHIKFSNLCSGQEIGRLAGQRAVDKLNSKKIKSCKLPVVFTPRVSRTILGHFLHSIDGLNVAKNMSFLCDMLGKKIFSSGIDIFDDSGIIGGHRSCAFDADGIFSGKVKLVNNGILMNFLHNIKSANMCNSKSTGHASFGGGIRPSNVFVQKSEKCESIKVDDLLRGLSKALVVTEVLGNGVNPITGNYSQGAVGFLFENGHKIHGVHEVTIAGNLKDIFLELIVTDDLKFETGIDCGSMFVPSLSIAGS